MKNEFTCLVKMDPRFPPLSEHSTLLRHLRVSWLERAWRKLMPERFGDGLSFFLQRNEFDVIITESHEDALVFGLFSRIAGRRARHVAKELYLAETVLRNRLKRWLCRIALADVDRVVVNAFSEKQPYADFLGIDPGRVVFVPWATNALLTTDSEDEGYVFAAGRSMRDWETLFESARSLRFPFVIVASRMDVASLNPPPNLQILCDVTRTEYLKRLRGAKIVVLPLAYTIRSTGQAVALEAMALRKPLVAADTPGLIDYVNEEENGLLYRAGDPASLTRQIERLLSDANLRQRLSENAAASIRRKFNKAAYSKRFFEAISELAQDFPQK